MGADRDWLLMAPEQTSRISTKQFTLLCRDNGKTALQTYHKTEDGRPRYVTPLGADFDWQLRAKPTDKSSGKSLRCSTWTPDNSAHASEVIESLRNDGEATVAFQTWHTTEGKNRLVTAMDAGWDWIAQGRDHRTAGQ